MPLSTGKKKLIMAPCAWLSKGRPFLMRPYPVPNMQSVALLAHSADNHLPILKRNTGQIDCLAQPREVCAVIDYVRYLLAYGRRQGDTLYTRLPKLDLRSPLDKDH